MNFNSTTKTGKIDKEKPEITQGTRELKLKLVENLLKGYSTIRILFNFVIELKHQKSGVLN